MANIKRTVTDAQGNFQYSVLHEHCSHSSAAGSFWCAVEGENRGKPMTKDEFNKMYVGEFKCEEKG